MAVAALPASTRPAPTMSRAYCTPGEFISRREHAVDRTCERTCPDGGPVAEPKAAAEPEGVRLAVARDRGEALGHLGLQAKRPRASACPDTTSGARTSCPAGPSPAGWTPGRGPGSRSPTTAVEAHAEDPATLLLRASSRSERPALDADQQQTAAQREGRSEQMTSSAVQIRLLLADFVRELTTF